MENPPQQKENQTAKRRSAPKITLFEHAKHSGWNGDADAKGLHVWHTYRASDCWERAYNTDVHFACYYVVGEKQIPRLNLTAAAAIEAAGMKLRFNIAALDIDHVPHSESPADEWREEQERLVFSAPWGKRVAMYHTRGGYRLVAKLGKGVNWREFEEYLSDWVKACRDSGVSIRKVDEARWNGLYRMPVVRRDGEVLRYPLHRMSPEEFEALPDLSPSWLKALLSAQESERRSIVGVDTPAALLDEVWNDNTTSGYSEPFRLPEVVEQGSRNVTMYKFASSLRARGLEQSSILELLVKEDRERGDPPIQDEDGGMRLLEDMARRVCKYEAPDPAEKAARDLRQAEGLSAAVAKEAESVTPKRLVEPEGARGKGKRKRTRRKALAALSREDEEGAAEIEAPRSVYQSDAVSVLRRSEDTPLFMHRSEVEFSKWCVREIVDEAEDLVHDQGTLRRYNSTTGVWEEIPDTELHKLVASLDRAHIYTGRDKDGKPKISKLAVSNSMTDSVTKLVNKLCYEQGKFAEAPPGIAFRNGFVRITAKGPVLEPFSREHCAVTRVDFDFDPKAKSPIFDAFLADVLTGTDSDDKIRFQWEFMGCSIAGMATRMQQAMLLVGEGANGKSTLLNVWIGLMPPGTVTSIPPQDIHNEYRLAHLKRSLLNACNEAPPSNIANSAALKAAISGDRVTARHIREAVFEYWPRAAHAFACNELPEYEDSSDGFSRRWIIQTFPRTFDVDEQVRDLDRKILKREKGAIICKALVAACDALARGSYVEPISSQAARHKWRKNNDPVFTFVTDACKPSGKGKGTAPNTLYSAFRAWASLNGVSPVPGSMKFYRSLSRMKITAKTVRGSKRYAIELASEDEED